MDDIPKAVKTERPPSPEDDLAFLRKVVEQGRAAAKISGGHLLVWGALIAAAYLFNYWVAVVRQSDYWLMGAGYAAMILLGWTGSAYLGWRAGRDGGATTIDVRIYAIIFACAGAALTVFAVGGSLSPTLHPNAIMVVGALMAGLCFLATGLLSRTRWIAAVGVLWMAASIGLLVLMDREIVLLVGAALWLALMAGPGAALTLEARRTPAPRRGPAADSLT